MITINTGKLWINSIQVRLLNQKRKLNWLLAITGGTGKGKTSSAIKLACTISPNKFIPKHNIHFSVFSLLTEIESKRTKEGDIFVMDEIGVSGKGMSSRDWYSEENKNFSNVMQTIRPMRLGIIFTSPALNFIDSQGRLVFHSLMEMLDVDEERDLAIGKLYNIQYNSRRQKIYYSRPAFTDEFGKRHIMNALAIGKPENAIWEEYEVMRTEYTKKLLSEAIHNIDAIKNPKEKPHKHTYEFRKKEMKWVCKYCNFSTLKNPFESTP
jgi:hypothetical protein